MSTTVVHPGASSAPSGKTIGMLVAGLAAAIVLGFVFYLNQSQDVTVSGVGTQTAESITDNWLLRQQAEVNAARDQAANYETARIKAEAVTQQPAQLDSARALQPLPEIANRVPEVDASSIIQSEIAAALAAFKASEQARIESESEAFGLTELFGADRANQAWSDRLTGLAESVGTDRATEAWTARLSGLAASVAPMIAPPLNELSLYTPVATPMIAPRLDELSHWANQTVNTVFAHEMGEVVDFYEKYDVPVDGSRINPAFAHEVN